MKTLWLALCVAFGLGLAVLTATPPCPLPADAPAGQFSAIRAFTDIKAIGAKAHPIGSDEHAKVRGYLVARLGAMGLKPSVFTADSVIAGLKNYARAARTSSIVATIPGKDSKLPALALMAHYDSVPNSPGAADDSAGVAVCLEIARALMAGDRPERDVIVLITDGEEVGLLGAKAFFDQHPLAAHIGVVLNFEARGDSGQTAMFETSADNAGLIARFAAAARHPSANSLAGALYARMPNGSDLTIVKNHGIDGLNFAFIGDESAYHSPLATPEHLNLASVQHMGEQALPTARALAMAGTLPEADHDAVYSDLFGLTLVHYPPAFGWLLLALAALLTGYGLWAGRKAARLCPQALAGGLAGAALVVTIAVLLLWPAGLVMGALPHFQRLPHYPQYALGALALLLAGIALAMAMLRLGKRRQSVPTATIQLWRGALIWGLVLSAVLQAALPQATPLILWPLAIAALIFALARGRGRPWLAGIALIPTAAWIGGFAIFLFDAMGTSHPWLLALPLIAALPVLAPVLGAAAEDRKLMPAGLALLLLGAGLVLYARFAPPSSARPLPTHVLHVQNHDSGQAWRVAGFDRLDPWARQVLSADGRTPTPAEIPGYQEQLWVAPATPAKLPAPQLDISRAGGRLTVAAKGRPGEYMMELTLRSSIPLDGVQINGRAVDKPIAADQWSMTVFYAPSDRVQSLSLKAPEHAKIEAILKATRPGWPKDVPALPVLPDNVMPMGISGYSQSVIARELRW